MKAPNSMSSATSSVLLLLLILPACSVMAQNVAAGDGQADAATPANLPKLGAGVKTNNNIPVAAPTTASEAAEATSEAVASENEPSKGATRTAAAASQSDAETTDSDSPPPPALSTETTATATTVDSDIPQLTTSTPGSLPNGGALPKNLPKLSGQYSYPAPTVPPTANAPFMQHSKVPEGTVFIVVGAALGFLAMTILAWRGMVAWSLHRSVKRAAQHQHLGDSKTMPSSRGNDMYFARTRSSLSVDHLTSNKRAAGGLRSQTASGLFFSPTARPGSAIEMSGNRGSSHLPAGYYAAGSQSPGPSAGMSQVSSGLGVGGIPGIGPQSKGYTRARSMGPSPPGSPALPPSRGGETAYTRAGGAPLPHLASSSSLNLNLNAPPQGRAPSAYLEDLFENHQPQPGHR